MKPGMSGVLTFLIAVSAGVTAEAEIVRVKLAERRVDPGMRQVILSVYGAAEGGEPIATETRTIRVDVRGAFEMPLGQLASAGKAAETRWLAVRVPPGKESPRVPVAPA